MTLPEPCPALEMKGAERVTIDRGVLQRQRLITAVLKAYGAVQRLGLPTPPRVADQAAVAWRRAACP